MNNVVAGSSEDVVNNWSLADNNILSLGIGVISEKVITGECLVGWVGRGACIEGH